MVKLKSLYGELCSLPSLSSIHDTYSAKMSKTFFYSHMIPQSLFTSYNCYYLAPSLKFLVFPLHCYIPNVQLAIYAHAYLWEDLSYQTQASSHLCFLQADIKARTPFIFLFSMHENCIFLFYKDG
ncbi:hypothetical protein ACB092_10G096800 [Castanea dentata]